ncbi:MAG TPA: hypothetical protein VFX16_11580 [Pseudonocardiaceae bacterium]|nr:hypothetical protein [Pseudonocardiaceae bacterium]
MAGSTREAEFIRQSAVWHDDSRNAVDFPYDLVMACYHAHGKQFVSNRLLQALDSIRAHLGPVDRENRHRALLDKFLSVALDKWDQKYDYQTYLGIDLLDLAPDADGETGRRQWDEWSGLLLADTWAFESGARDSSHDWLSLLRPGPELTIKRMHILGTTMARILARRTISVESGDDVDEAARQIVESAPAERKLALRLCMQPVYVVHDEYLFIRILQCFEVVFAAMSAEMRDAIDAVRRRQPAHAAACIARCGDVLATSRCLFTLLATMQAEAFRAFRVYTVGASAIQSRNYKIFEALCASPSPARIDSPAYESVPQVRERIGNGWLDLTSAVREAVSHDSLEPRDVSLIYTAARRLDAIHQGWKQTHWKLAARMIGDDRGTGYTVGVPYLRDAIENRLFRHPLGPDVERSHAR